MPVINSKKSLQIKDLLGLFPWIPTGKVLDAGCGEGQLAHSLAQYGFAVEASDVSFDNIENCYQKYGGLVEWQVSDIRSLKIERNSYSAIFCINVFPFIPDDQRTEIIEKFKKGLKPGGLLIISGFNSNDPANDANFARDIGKPQPLPTGIIKNDELVSYFDSWEIFHNFQGIVKDNHQPVGQHIHGISDIVVRKPEPKVYEKVNWKQIPILGVGLGWREDLRQIIEEPGNIDFIEIMLDDYLEPDDDDYLFELVKKYKVIPHGVELSIGSAHGIDEFYLQSAKRVINRCQSPWWSDHLCFTTSESAKTYSLNPLPFTSETFDILSRNIKQVKSQIKTPFLLENVAYYLQHEQSYIEESEFMKNLSIATDTGILLDLANLYGNSRNLNIDPFKFINNLPSDRVLQVHLAGGRYHQGILFDTHDSPIYKETWELLSYLLKKCDVKAISIERDDGYENMQELVKELGSVRQMLGLRL